MGREPTDPMEDNNCFAHLLCSDSLSCTKLGKHPQYPAILHVDILDM